MMIQMGLDAFAMLYVIVLFLGILIGMMISKAM